MKSWFIQLTLTLLTLELYYCSDYRSLLYYREPIPDLVIQENEVIRLRLKDYFGGSFLQYTLSIPDAEKYQLDSSFIEIPQESYKMATSGTYNIKKLTDSLFDTTRLLIIHEPGKQEKKYILSISEDFYIRILDFTNIKTNAEPSRVMIQTEDDQEE